MNSLGIDTMSARQRTNPRNNMFYLYLSTLSTTNPPVSNANLNNVTFNVNWDLLFSSLGKSLEPTIFVSARLVSTGSAALTWNNNKGTVRCNLPSPYGSDGNGMNLGSIIPYQDPTVYPPSNPPVCYLQLDTTQNTTTQQIIRPYGLSQLNIKIFDKTESPMPNVTDYELFLYFYTEKNMV
jgi:hypothetical protein